MPRKRSEDFYKLHGFTANYKQKKYTATCHFCGKVLQNTALTRLSLHRQICTQQSPVARDSRTKKVEKDLESRHCIKEYFQEFSGEDDEDCLTEGKEIIVKIQQIIDSADDENADKTRTPVLVRSETRKSANPDHEPEQHLEFEISGADFGDDEFKEEHLGESPNGSTTILEARPRSNLHALKAEKMRAEIKQYHSKTHFFRTETENLKVERTLTLLKIQKLRLEIDALRD
ncbi:uncharacterized protein [Drosophila kikkawai]|uniref:BED-type domain-containing protein n=1 Tax=Drosophila kikkawai TaxID=30033 RepID=A0ABM4GJ28_DROKI